MSLLVMSAVVAQPGEVRVHDGDTLYAGGMSVRLFGVDAPELDAVCVRFDGTVWACGVWARERLMEITRGGVRCEATGLDRFDRVIGRCVTLRGVNVSAEMVRSGAAVAFVRYSRAHVADEAAARQARRGVWSGTFEMPWDMRRRLRGELGQ